MRRRKLQRKLRKSNPKGKGKKQKRILPWKSRKKEVLSRREWPAVSNDTENKVR